MDLKLSNDDGCAVDLILEHAVPGANGGFSPCFSTAPSQQMLQRLSRVEAYLGVLSAMPEVLPSSDLIQRTLNRCEEDRQYRATMGTPTEKDASVATAR